MGNGLHFNSIVSNQFSALHFVPTISAALFCIANSGHCIEGALQREIIVFCPSFHLITENINKFKNKLANVMTVGNIEIAL